MNPIQPVLFLCLVLWNRSQLLQFLCCLPLVLLAAFSTQQPTAKQPAEANASIAAVAPQAAEEANPPPVRRADDIAASASSEKIAALRSWVDQHERLYSIAAPLLITSTPLCKHYAQALIGLTAKTQYSYPAYFFVVG